MSHKVELVGITNPVIPGIKSVEHLIAYQARVSNQDNQMNEDYSRILKYMIKHKHWSPFEMVSMTVGIQTTRDIGRQILRHRSFSYQEFSQRYAEVDNYITNRQARFQDTVNKQNSFESSNPEDQRFFEKLQREVADLSMYLYAKALNAGIAKEQARALLPEGLTITNMYMAGNIRSWIHYIQLRCGKETQLEHRLIAKDIARLLLEPFPSLSFIIEPCLEERYSAES